MSNELDLCGQYLREVGECYLFFNRESNRKFNEFYQRRRNIGRMIFRQLRARGYNLTDRRTLELFANIYDSIGIEFSTAVVDRNTYELKNNHSRNNMDNRYNDYSIYTKGEDLIVAGGTMVYQGKGRQARMEYRNLDLDEFDNFVLLNPRNGRQQRMMRNLLDTNRNVIVGYFGDTSDRCMDNHREQIETLQEETNTEIIENVGINNSYAYILTNNRRR